MPEFASKVESTDGDIVTPCACASREGGRQSEGWREGKGAGTKTNPRREGMTERKKETNCETNKITNRMKRRQKREEGEVRVKSTAEGRQSGGER